MVVEMATKKKTNADDDNNDIQPHLPGNEQTPDERRAIRCDLRHILEETKRKQQDLVTPQSGRDGLQDALQRTDNIFKKVKNPREAVIDAQILVVVSEVAKQRAQSLHTNLVVFQPAEYAKKLCKFVDEESLEAEEDRNGLSSEGWFRLGTAVQSFFKRSPPLHLIYGSFDPGPPKEKKVTRAKEKDPDGPKTAVVPKQLKDFSETQKTENTSEEVEKMHKILQKLYRKQNNQPLCYFEFVVNPESFGQTIENLFYASFLIKDGHARIFLDSDKLPVIEPIEKAEGTQDQNTMKRHQVVMTLTKKDYEELKRTFNIKPPALIPTRIPMADRSNQEDDGPSNSKSKRR